VSLDASGIAPNDAASVDAVRFSLRLGAGPWAAHTADVRPLSD
jgi:hypothetical protein